MDSPAELRETEVDLAGLLRVLGHHLYSTRTVAIRELVQNAHDSCVRRRLEDGTGFEPDIRLETDLTEGRLVVEDNGAGLTRDEVIRYLATVGSGYTGQLRDDERSDELIGRFGLGFLSALFVADRIEVHVTSYQEPDRGWRFATTGNGRYSLQPAPARAIGMRVALNLNAECRRLAESDRLDALLRHHCRFLRFPVSLGSAPPLNRPEPPWRRDDDVTPLRQSKDDLELAADFEEVFEPLCTQRIQPDGDGQARGLVWIQDGSTYGGSDNRNVRVYVRGMLVDPDARELLPAWAGFVGAVVEADDLNPTASRESLQVDDRFAATQRQLRETVVECLRHVARHDEACWRRILARHEQELRGAALCDERLFATLKDRLRVPTSEGELTVGEVLERSDGRLHVTLGEGGTAEEIMLRAVRVPVVTGTRHAALSFCREYLGGDESRLVTIGTAEGNRALFRDAEVEPHTREWLEASFGGEGLEVVPCHYEPAHVPVVLVPDRDAELKRRLESDDVDRRISTAALGLARLHVAGLDDEVLARVHVNMGSPVIQALDRTEDIGRRDAVASALRALSELTCRSDGQQVGDGAPENFARLTESLMTLLERS
ncbi:MAG: ATP-binding protein [Acidobacteriota bacterium]